MKTSSNRWLVLAVSMTLVLLAASSSVRTSANLVSPAEIAAEDSCKCADLPALISRRREVVAAINAIDARLMQVANEEKQSGKVIAYTEIDYANYFYGPMQIAMHLAHDKNTAEVHGPTKFTSDCSPTTNSADNPSCFWQGLVLNEAERSKWCESPLRGGAANERRVLGGDWLAKYPIANFAEVDRKGYQAEKAYLDQTIRNLFNRCKFSQWSGEIVVSYTSETTFKKGGPALGAAPGPHQNQRTEEFRANEAEQVVITLVDGNPSADGTASYSKHEEIQDGPETWCHASTLGNKAFVPWSKTAITDYQVSGPVYGGAVASVSFRSDGTYTISVRLPAGAGSGTSSTDNTETGECAAKPTHNSSPVTYAVGGFHVRGTGNGKDTALELNGADKPKPDVSPKGTETEITMEWHLKRSKPQ